jgi:hypothetical protein
MDRSEQLENELVDRFYHDVDNLRTPKTGVFFDVAPLPECESDFKQGIKPKVYVMYDNSDYPESENLNMVVQEDKMKFGFEIHARTRRGDNGVFAVKQMIIAFILGYKPKGCDKFQLVSFSPLQGGAPNHWMYYVQFITTSHIAESLPDVVEDEPLLNTVNIV